jgi:hypothetical protein
MVSKPCTCCSCFCTAVWSSGMRDGLGVRRKGCMQSTDLVCCTVLQPQANAAVTLPTAKKRARAALPPEVAGMAAVQEQKTRCALNPKFQNPFVNGHCCRLEFLS